ncbi:AP2-associated protein kinase 1 isoform X3 [Tripterygium wilfordii]|uniref:non-specific serine/threonine protein kinase n=1 Tax=Tripterygium wilfordii TaxID=458696 RepID=A0A7J7CW91_TRIWF|nr:AP2-associated protein kinase 1-like [Tripterygium wilfordii]KAF5738360.1 AP2-associated protein kinase 1 isoform X3 [Tripterygium wilfordii]
MWRFKPFMHKEPTGLEGRSIDVGDLKIHVQKAFAEGGFSCVYFARDAVHPSKQYALKHMVCNDEESLELVMKEISVMKSLKGHPNIVTLHAHSIFDMGRTKEALLVMEFCEKSLVHVLLSRGSGYFEEKQVLSIFRDVCNAVFAMHCQSPPIAHRDLKVENILLGHDELWKLCDFGSTSTNHKIFEKPEEMGIEEDNIRKHTTPAYRAPEMWDLFRRDLINEKVDIWALGCLLFRICYFKNAFDGESKLQILNGNYRIPELPKYSLAITGLIRDMLQDSPHDRPDITQVWFRVNEQLPANMQKSLPDRPPEMKSAGIHEGISKPADRLPPMPHRSPPPPPSSGESTRTTSSGIGSGSGFGAFWSTQHAKDSLVSEDMSKPKFDEEPLSHNTLKHDRSRPENHPLPKNTSHARDDDAHFHAARRNSHGKSHKRVDGPSKDSEITFFQKDTEHGTEKPRSSKSDGAAVFQDEAFNTFVSEFDASNVNPVMSSNRPGNEETLEAEIERLRDQLKQVNSEKAEITSKFDKLSAICRSQRQEIQELKQALAARTPSPSKEASRNQTSSGVGPYSTPQRESDGWNTPNPVPWQAFADDPKGPKPLQQPFSQDKSPHSVRTRNGQPNKQDAQVTANVDTWGFGTDYFAANPPASSQGLRPSSEQNTSQGIGEPKIAESQSTAQPAGWAGF